MATLEAIRDAIKTTIEAGIPTLRAYDTIPESAELPAVTVRPVTADFNVAFGRGMDTWLFDLNVLVSWGDSDLAQDHLDAYVTGAGASSIRQTIFNARTLGLAGTDAHVSQLLEYGAQFEVAGVQHVGARLRLVVHTIGTA